MRRSKREIERAVGELSEDAIADDVDLTARQAKAIREYTLPGGSLNDLDDELEAALLEVADDA